MNNQIIKRLAALEQTALQSSAEPDADLAATIAAMSDTEIGIAVQQGLRERKLNMLHGRIYGGHDPFWHPLAERATDLFWERECWAPPITPAEAELVAAALESGALRVADWPGRMPSCSGSYQLLPPAPYPDGYWQTDQHQAACMAQLTLWQWADYTRGLDAPAAPITSTAIAEWLRGLWRQEEASE